jgi:phosphoribosylaminoimidazole-succinocarboxamide synthase
MPEEVHQHREQLEGRPILVKKAEGMPLEAIVRGYITGEHSVNRVKYTPRRLSLTFSRFCVGRVQKVSSVHGIPLPEGLLESEKFPNPLFAPSTKAEQGAHDENIFPERGAYLSL